MFLSRYEKSLVLLSRIEDIRGKALWGFYKEYDIAENKIRKLEKKIRRLGFDPDTKLRIVYKGGL